MKNSPALIENKKKSKQKEETRETQKRSENSRSVIPKPYKQRAHAYKINKDLEPFLVPIGDLKPDPENIRLKRIPISQINIAAYNPRLDLKPGDEEYDKIRRSITEFGLVEPLVWNEATGTLVGGHQRLKILKDRGDTEVEVSVVNIDDLKREKALNIALNKVQGDWNLPSLKELLVDLNDGQFDLTLTGFDEAELQRMIDWEGREGETDADAVPPAPKNPKARPGHLYVLGSHRLLCGDATDLKSVARLMDGKKSRLMNTDPPYGVAYVSKAKSKKQAKNFAEIENDEVDGKKLQGFLERVIKVAVPHLADKCAFYLWHPMLTQGTFFAAAAAADIIINRQIIWVKPSMVFGRGDYHWRHELCFYGWRRGHKPDFFGERNQTTIWEAGRENDGIHPTQKPVELFLRPIINHTREAEVVYEPFSGSGSQIIAAEKTGRRCFAMEIEPGYVDVAIRRWEEFTGKKAELIK